MREPELIIMGDKSLAIFNVVVFTAASVAIGYSWGAQLFIKIDRTGIWKQKHEFSPVLKLFIPWDNISYYYIQVEPSRSLPTSSLIIRKKEPDVAVKLGITDTNVGPEVILAVLKVYAEAYGFHDFVQDLVAFADIVAFADSLSTDSKI